MTPARTYLAVLLSGSGDWNAVRLPADNAVWHRRHRSAVVFSVDATMFSWESSL